MSEDFQAKTRETHASQCESLQGPLRDHYAITYGIVCDSILNTSRFFHVTEGLIPDVMHDVLEGVLPYVTKELLKNLISGRVVTFADLHSAMQSFPYAGQDLKNRPVPVERKTLRS